MADKNNESQGTNYTLLVIFSVVVILLYLGSWFLIDYFYACPERRGQFGDQFGAVNALFSGLAFAGLIFTIILQKKELALQREELTQTREELRGQKEQLEIQNTTLKVQRFENTFFQMLAQFQQIVNSITFTYFDKETNSIQTVTGRNAFYVAFEVASHKSNLPDMKSFNTSGWYRGMRNIIKCHGMNGYMETFSPTYFDHYFRFLYRILKFVKNSPLVTNFDEEYEYTSMLRATLSRYELIWLYYNGLTYGKEKLKPLMERYSMLNNLRCELLAGPRDEFGVYAPSVWKKFDKQQR